MYWILAAAVLVALAWYVGRLRRMHALRGRHHLVDLAAGLRQMQPQVKRGYGQFTSHSAADSERAPPSHTTASGGALVAWTAAPAPEGGALHKITLVSYYETWWINGFLMLFICERLGLDLDAIRITRTDRGTTHLFVTLSNDAHAVLMDRKIDDPPESGFAQYRDALATRLARGAPPPVVDARQFAAHRTSA